MELPPGAAFSAMMPAVTHHWKDLSFRDDTVWHQLPGKPDTEYLATPPIEITGKKDAVPERDDPRVAFRFELNAAPDPVWQQLFAANLTQVPSGIPRAELTVTFFERQLRLLCLASHLERVYPFLKATVAKTNTDYEAEKHIVLAHVRTAAQYRNTDAPQADTKTDIAQEKLTQLEL